MPPVLCTNIINQGAITLVASRNMLNNQTYKYLGNDESVPSNLTFDFNSQEIENKLRFEENLRISGFKNQRWTELRICTV